MAMTLRNDDIQTFKMGNSLLGSVQPVFGTNFSEVLEKQVQEEDMKKAKGKEKDIIGDDVIPIKKKKGKEKEGLMDVSKIMQNDSRQDVRSPQGTLSLLNKFKEKKQLNNEEPSPREQTFNNVCNVAGQALVQPVYDQGPRQSKAKMLDNWEKLAPVVTEDATKKAVRVDIPLVNDIQAIVLRIHPDKSISASILGSKIMGDLLRSNKAQLDRNLKNHRLSLRSLNTFYTEIEFNNEAGTQKKKKKSNKPMVDSI